jgi:hypothetical protein
MRSPCCLYMCVSVCHCVCLCVCVSPLFFSLISYAFRILYKESRRLVLPITSCIVVHSLSSFCWICTLANVYIVIHVKLFSLE